MNLAQVICSEITESYCGFFKIGTPVFCSEFIAFLVKIEMEKKYLLNKMADKYIEKLESMLCLNSI